MVECAERKEKADETPHLIDLEGVNVAGVVKVGLLFFILSADTNPSPQRRRSMLPRFIARELEEENSQQNRDKEGNNDAEKSSSCECGLLPCAQNFLRVIPCSHRLGR